MDAPKRNNLSIQRQNVKWCSHSPLDILSPLIIRFVFIEFAAGCCFFNTPPLSSFIMLVCAILQFFIVTSDRIVEWEMISTSSMISSDSAPLLSSCLKCPPSLFLLFGWCCCSCCAVLTSLSFFRLVLLFMTMYLIITSLIASPYIMLPPATIITSWTTLFWSRWLLCY